MKVKKMTDEEEMAMKDQIYGKNDEDASEQTDEEFQKEVDAALKLIGHTTISNDAEVALYRIFLDKKK